MENLYLYSTNLWCCNMQKKSPVYLKAAAIHVAVGNASVRVKRRERWMPFAYECILHIFCKAYRLVASTIAMPYQGCLPTEAYTALSLDERWIPTRKKMLLISILRSGWIVGWIRKRLRARHGLHTPNAFACWMAILCVYVFYTHLNEFDLPQFLRGQLGLNAIHPTLSK